MRKPLSTILNQQSGLVNLAVTADPSNMFDTFYSKMSEILYRHMYTHLMKQLSRKEMKLKFKPWITPEIKTSDNIKNNFLKKKNVKTKSHYHGTFKVCRNELNDVIKINHRHIRMTIFHKFEQQC